MTALVTEPKLAGGFTRRGACPALSAPMQTGDGLLVRLNPVIGGLSPRALIGLCDAAETYGNGVVEITARGSLQLRGLTQKSAVQFTQTVDMLGIPVRTGVPVQTGILSGLDPREIRDPTDLAEKTRSGIVAANLETRLGPKVSVVVDGGGMTALAEVAADVRLTAVGGELWQIAIAGDARSAEPLGVVEGDRTAADLTIALLNRIADQGRTARARDLVHEKLAFLINNLGSSPSTSLANVSLIGITELRDRSALGVALPFGHTIAKHLKTFAKEAERLGVNDLRPAPGRTLVVLFSDASTALNLQKLAQTLGFVTAPDDPRLSISACAGLPDCASGHIPARKIAAEIAREYNSLLESSVHLHVSGCAKGCAHPAASTLVLVGSPAGIGLVADGTARDEPIAYLTKDGAGRGFARLAERRDSGETTAQAIKRIGLSAIAEDFEQGGT